MSNLFNDLRIALRTLWRTPGFSLAAVVVMALGIGANSAIFSVVHAILLKPLPFEQPDRLVEVWHIPPPKAFPGMTRFSVSPANYLDWRAMNHVFTDMAILGGIGLTIGGDRPEQVTAAAVSANFFSVLGSRPMLGRGFVAEEDQPGRNNSIILSHRIWRDHYGSDPNIIGKPLDFSGQKLTVAGVMGPDFTYPSFAQVWTPVGLTDAERAVRGIHDYSVVARLKDGVSLQQANAELAAISNNLAQAYPADDKDWGAAAGSLREELVGNVRAALLTLLGAVIFVLLIACANVANLLLAKALAKRHEVAIRVALGASRRRLIQQILCESIALSFIGGALGLLLAHFGIKVIVAFLSGSLPRSAEMSLNTSVVLFTVLLSLLTGVLSGLVPAARFSGASASEGLKEGAGRAGTEHGSLQARGLLLIAEVALSLLLLVGAGLMIRTLWHLQNIDPGFQVSNGVTMYLGFGERSYPSREAQVNALDQMLQNVRAIPGIQQAGMINSMPLTGGSHQPIQAEGHPVVAMAEQPEMAVRVMTPGYLQAMNIPLKKGRDLNSADNADRPGAVLISESMARVLWPDQDPIGKHLTLTFSPQKIREVVGVVGDVKQDSLTATTPDPTLYQPFAQMDPTPDDAHSYHARPMWLVVRHAPGVDVTKAVASSVHEVDRNVPILNVLTLESFIGEILQGRKANMSLLMSFAVVALILAALGIYSVLAYSVRRRVREIGIRMALGAKMGDIVRLIVLQGLRPVAMGIVIGLALSLALGRAVASMVYGVKTTDLVTLGVGSILLFVVAGIASFVPAYRATQVQPVEILRQE